MHQFKTASRSLEEIKSDNLHVAELFNKIRGANGQINRGAMEDLVKAQFKLGELIIELVDDQVVTNDPTGFLVEQRDLDIRDDFVFQEVSAALRVVDYAHGTKPQSQRLSFSEYGLTTSAHEIAVEVPLIQIASGRYNPALISEVMAEAVSRDRIGRVLTAIDAAVPSAADRSGLAGFNLRYVGLTEANMKKAVNGLLDEGLQPTFFGRHGALIGIQDFAGWATGSEAAIREFETRGMIGSFYGAPIVTLRDQFSKRTNSHVIPYNRVYAASGKKGAIFLTRDLSFLNYSEVKPAEGIYRVGLRYEDGLLMHDAYQYRIIEVS